MNESHQYKVIKELGDLSNEADSITICTIKKYAEEPALNAFLQQVKDAIYKIRTADSVEEVQKVVENALSSCLIKNNCKLDIEFPVSQKERLHLTTGVNDSGSKTDSNEPNQKIYNGEKIDKNASMSPVVVLHNILPDSQSVKTAKLLCDKQKFSNLQDYSTPITKKIICDPSLKKTKQVSIVLLDKMHLYKDSVTCDINSFNKSLTTSLNHHNVLSDSSSNTNMTKLSKPIPVCEKTPVVVIHKASVYSAMKTPVKHGKNESLYTTMTKPDKDLSSACPKAREESVSITTSHKRKSSTERLPKKLRTENSEALNLKSRVNSITAKNSALRVIAHENIKPNLDTSSVIKKCKPVRNDTVEMKNKELEEEIKKKEEKAVQNMKKVLRERHLKAEEKKRKREEKLEKTALNRQKLKEEKEQRLKKCENDVIKASQSKNTVEPAKGVKLNTKSKETIVDQKEDKKTVKSQVLVTPVKNKTSANKSPAPEKDDQESETYDMTPFRPSGSACDDDEQPPSKSKKIPHWARGLHLQQAILLQHYNPPDVDAIFGSVIHSPVLSKILGVSKPKYNKRTSSAFWTKTPNHSLLM